MTPPLPPKWLVAVVWNSDDRPPPDQSFDCLAMNLTRVVQYQGDVWIWIAGPYPSRGTPPPSIKECPQDPKFFGSLLDGHFSPPPLTTNFPCALLTISHYLYNIAVNRIRFYWIGEQYTSFCCWLIQMFIHKPFSLLPLEWTVDSPVDNSLVRCIIQNPFHGA